MKKVLMRTIIVLAFLTLIGIELIAQGLGVVLPERLFSGMMIIALFTAILYQLRFTAPVQP